MAKSNSAEWAEF